MYERTRPSCTLVHMAADYFAGDPRTNWDRMRDGDDYIADDPRIFEATNRAAQLAARFEQEVLAGDDAVARATLVDLLGSLGANVWLGGGIIVCPGVTIGDDSVIGAGSVVTRDIPAGVIAVGNPARVLRSL